MAEEKKNVVQKREPTNAERFTSKVMAEAKAQAGIVQFDEHQKRLVQHLFIKIDSVLKDLEAKRLSKKQTAILPYEWQNINTRKLALDAYHRIELNLDALIPNHIHPIPYKNSRLKAYDLDLRIGYAGKDYYRQQVAMEKPISVVYELVYDTDIFQAIKTPEGDSYKFEIANPWKRGKILGGFGYLVFDDPRKNRLIMVSEDEFIKSSKHAQTDDFWKRHPEQMRYKTLVHRVTDHLTIDPNKVSPSYLAVEESENDISGTPAEANLGSYIDITNDPEPEPEETETQDAPPADETTGEVKESDDGTLPLGDKDDPGF